MKQAIYTLFSFCFFLGFSCTKDQNGIYSDAEAAISRSAYRLPLQEHPIAPLPAFNPAPPVLPAVPYDYSTNNPHGITDEGATLGRVLFYDKRLTQNKRGSCASCHKQEYSFADNRRFSKGYSGILTTRNAPTLLNLNPEHDFFWDMREDHLYEMVLKPILNPDEMGIYSMDTVLQRLEEAGFYADLFQDAFGTPDITTDRIGHALNQFVLSIRSDQSQFDSELQANYATWNPSVGPVVQIGQIAFGDRGRCFTCHGGPDTNERRFSDINGNEIVIFEANIGLDTVYADIGAGAFDPDKEGVFKVPTLRNIALTAPYMHDGRFQTLEEVIDHYSDDVQPHPNLDSRIKNSLDGTPFNANFTEEEKEGLLAFMQFFTDYSVTTAEKWSNPFEE